MTRRRGLQAFLTVLGIVAFVAGSGTVLTGAEFIAGAEDVSASVDSEIRFYATWYAAAGLVLLYAARRVESVGSIVRVLSGTVFAAGCSRLLSLAVVGRPHTLALVLMVIELVLPAILLPWQTSVERSAT